MSHSSSQGSTISIIVPIFNEALNIHKLYQTIDELFSGLQHNYELILVNDGSSDNSADIMDDYQSDHPHVKALHLARNFGKEIALSAGLHNASGDAAIMIDADLQHPPRYIPEFIQKWEQGADVVVGVRTETGKSSQLHHYASVLYYKILGMLSEVPVIPHATDFRLLDRQVIDEFSRFTEHNRMLRGLVDWLGYKRDYVYFAADERHAGEKTYSTRKLIKLAMNSFVSLSIVPLKFANWLGIVITALSGPFGLYMFIDKYFFDNRQHFTSASSLSVLVIFLVGIMLTSIGLVGIYIASIHNEVSNRPLYVIRHRRGRNRQNRHNQATGDHHQANPTK